MALHEHQLHGDARCQSSSGLPGPEISSRKNESEYGIRLDRNDDARGWSAANEMIFIFDNSIFESAQALRAIKNTQKANKMPPTYFEQTSEVRTKKR